MYLKNSQYQEIMRLYDEKQSRQRRLLELRRSEIYKAFPEYARLEDEITSLWASGARAAARRAPGSLTEDITEKVRLLTQQQKQILTGAGYPEDYLELQYDCPICRDTGFTGSEKCRCFTAAAAELLQKQSNIQSVLEKENFDTFRLEYYSDLTDPAIGISPRENMRSVLNVCRQFIRDFDEKGGSLLL